MMIIFFFPESRIYIQIANKLAPDSHTLSLSFSFSPSVISAAFGFIAP